MDRRITNIIKFLMDECLPPVIRDSRWFMYPFYIYAYRNKNIDKVMQFKTLLHTFSEQEYSDFYNSLDTISRNRETDIVQPMVGQIISALPSDTKTVLDVGCGHGYLLNRIRETLPQAKLTGCDVKPPAEHKNFNFLHGTLKNLNIAEKSSDVVTCCHVIEHIVKPEEFVSSLKKIARKKIIVAVPCQRDFYYTLDEHINFFPYREKLISLMDCKTFSCEKIWGDWLYIGDV